jgi:hypothetical protein
MWVKSTTSGQADLLTATIPGNTAQGMLIGFGEDGKLRYVPRQGRNDTGITSPEPCNDGAWHHVAAVKDGSTATLDVDGISVGIATVGNNFSTALHLLLGEEKMVRASAAYPFTGGQTERAQ